MTKTPEGIEVIEGPQPGKWRRFTQLGGAAQRHFVEPLVSLAATDGTG